ncbi:DUF739 family protein [Anaeromicropila populeti]|uniref:DUF739 domain-containing protein n=1 Tax=Anaeromicropila populeti TaxID=37658 RepID=A0A1I6JPD5_9FIRM|nr:DUF739 family protein [Anaeromicropila populeti]SFR80847.1 Protein of unknown function [Anaeromicropila populeti]
MSSQEKKVLHYNYNKLLGKIKELYGTQEKFALELGIGRVSLSQRLNCKLEFSQQEISRSIDLLGLNKNDIPLYFFTEK